MGSKLLTIPKRTKIKVAISPELVNLISWLKAHFSTLFKVFDLQNTNRSFDAAFAAKWPSAFGSLYVYNIDSMLDCGAEFAKARFWLYS